MSLPSLMLEPLWDSLQPGDRVNVLAVLQIYDPVSNQHVATSSIGNQKLVITGTLPNVFAISLLETLVVETASGFILNADEGYVLPHQLPGPDIYGDVIELCAGIGCMGEGFKAAGLHVKQSCDISAAFCDWQKAQGNHAIIQADITKPATWAKIHKAHGSPAVIAAGFNCQPWSALGDHGKTADPRSATFVATLQAAFFLRAHTVVLECVEGAGQDPNIQHRLRQFCQVTNFRMAQVTLSLQDVMPAKRNRWWCVLTDPLTAVPTLRPLPRLDDPPVLSDVLPFAIQCPQDELTQLALDRYDTHKFHACGGLHDKIITSNQILPTALHGWSVQLIACPCGCRAHPMTEQRLSQKGLFGALVQLEGVWHTSSGDLPCTRHMHPWEISLVHGVCPSKQWMPHLRLGICGLGQMASPIHSCWVIAQIAPLWPYPPQTSFMHPEQALWSLFENLFHDASLTHPQVTQHAQFQQFASRVQQKLSAIVHSRTCTASLSGIETNQEQTNSQGGGPKNPQEKRNSQGAGPEDLTRKEKQPASGGPTPTKQPAMGPQESQEFHKMYPVPLFMPCLWKGGTALTLTLPPLPMMLNQHPCPVPVFSLRNWPRPWKCHQPSQRWSCRICHPGQTQESTSHITSGDTTFAHACTGPCQ